MRKILYGFIILILLISNCNGKSTGIELPQVANNCIHGECVSDQFVGKYYNGDIYNYAVVIKETDIKQKPSYNATSISKLFLLDRVIVLYRKEKDELYNNKTGNWLFIQLTYLQSPSDIKGWIFNDSLGFKSMFKNDPALKFKRVEYSYGDVNYFITFSSNHEYAGRWLNTYPSDGSANGKMKGLYYRYGNILFLDDMDANNYDLFIRLCNQKNDEGCMLKIIE